MFLPCRLVFSSEVTSTFKSAFRQTSGGPFTRSCVVHLKWVRVCVGWLILLCLAKCESSFELCCGPNKQTVVHLKISFFLFSYIGLSRGPKVNLKKLENFFCIPSPDKLKPCKPPYRLEELNKFWILAAPKNPDIISFMFYSIFRPKQLYMKSKLEVTNLLLIAWCIYLC